MDELEKELEERRNKVEYWQHQAGQERISLREAITQLQAVHRPCCPKCGAALKPQGDNRNGTKQTPKPQE